NGRWQMANARLRMGEFFISFLARKLIFLFTMYWGHKTCDSVTRPRAMCNCEDEGSVLELCQYENKCHNSRTPIPSSPPANGRSLYWSARSVPLRMSISGLEGRSSWKA